ncbi:hypothetical protein COLAER_01231 [Collinsella aerofaciens ATCC 25986]|uniref:Uncharacterized protein n=1 Tax=Collinsella aerofaciens (strain ATCC 25986 / DSM 3979 / JCM 10188 / KCTC 3647 / NCTC 11838 / VPI 1003) TaxID=411903 RepID=A4E9X7_COLAA|nr:hypothetical protein COLAER_01231 [Collinsella aerofaciens ATCC 25986]
MNGERSFLPAQRKEAQLRYIYAIYVQLYFNRAGIRLDYANYISTKHKTDNVISYSHYTRFYALIRRVCTPAKTWGFSFSIRNKDELQKGNQPQSTGIEGGNSQNSIHPQSGALFRGKAAKQRRGLKAPTTTSFIQPHNPRT